MHPFFAPLGGTRQDDWCCRRVILRVNEGEGEHA